MASINRRLKKGMSAHCSVLGSVEKKGGDANLRAPWSSEREGEKSADRWALLRSERGKAEARGLSAAERAAPLGRVPVVGGGGVVG